MLKICVMGLGYVGLPVALGVSKRFNTVAYDINTRRVKELQNNFDSNNEFSKKSFIKKKILFTSHFNDIKSCNFFIICVPTPTKKNKLPDLSSVDKCISKISKIIKKNDIIVLESTVYPGVTDSCSFKLEKKTKLKKNRDFYMCYSPERINPGDKQKKIDQIEKVFAIETNKKMILKNVINVYKLISKKIIFSKNIKEAETAKAIENTQRDLNIALFNELLMFSYKLQLNYKEIISLASTKWNFIKFKPGLVGGHCLPVDPYYLSYVASKKKFNTKTLLAGRNTNNGMKNFVLKIFNEYVKKRKLKKNVKILVIGMGYKYGVSDLRNSLNLEIFQKIKKKFKFTKIYDPFVKISDQVLSIKKINNFKMFIFLSDGEKYKKLFSKIKKNNSYILDPFNYFL